MKIAAITSFLFFPPISLEAFSIGWSTTSEKIHLVAFILLLFFGGCLVCLWLASVFERINNKRKGPPRPPQ